MSCRNGFFNGINCHGSRYCVTWGLLQEGEEESGKDSETQTEEVAETQNEEADSNISAESDGNVENENEENKGHCTTWVKCNGGFWRGHRCSGGRYCSRWGGGGGGGRVCKKYVSCRNGFFNGINCHGSRHCVTWGLLQEGEEESGKDSETQTEEVAETQNEEADSSISAESDGNVENGTRRTRDIAQLGSSATEDSGVAIGAAADATAQDGVVAVVEAVCARST